MTTKKSPESIYQAEKARSKKERQSPHDALMAEAQKAFDEMLEQGKAARKGGRPKGSKNGAKIAPIVAPEGLEVEED